MPISNLSFLSKTLEESSPLKSTNIPMTTDNCIMGSVSSETALIRVINDIQHVIDDQYESILVLVRPCAAFYTIDHEILLRDYDFVMASLT